MRKWIIPLLVFLSMLLPLRVLAQASVSLTSLVIDIWPEYDKPTVLVIYHLTLSSNTTFPASVSVQIPTTAGEPFAVAERQVDGALYSISSTRHVVGNWASISFTTTSSEIQVEYYDPSLMKDNNARHYQFVWPGGYAIAQLVINVQQPIGATDMRISPSFGAGVTGTDGLTYYSQDLGAVSGSQNVQITIDYQKSSEALSTQNLQLEPSAPIPQGGPSDLNISTWLPWVLGILGAGLIIGGILWYWQSGRQQPLQQILRRRSGASASSHEGAGDAEEAEVYCSQCGKRALPGDQFCRSCGSPIRAR